MRVARHFSSADAGLDDGAASGVTHHPVGNDLTHADYQIGLAEQAVDADRRAIRRLANGTKILLCLPVVDQHRIFVRDAPAKLLLDLLRAHPGMSASGNQYLHVLARASALFQPP